MSGRPLINFAWIFAGLFVASAAVAGQNSVSSSGTWSGMLVSSSCNADEAFAESPECTKTLPDAKLALYDDTNRVMYDLEPQESITAKLGDIVTVRGTFDGETIHLGSLELMSIGLAVGEKAATLLSHRSERSRANSRNSEGTEWHGTPLFPLRRLVTLLQRAAGSAAERNSPIRKARCEIRRHQL